MSTLGASRRAQGGALAVALLGLVLALVGTGLLRWLGTAAVLATAPPLWQVLASQPWWQRRRARVPPSLLLALSVLLLGPLLAGDPPASRDHGIHYFQIRMLVEELLPSGRLWGWSPSLNHGYPYGESYPVLGYLWMAAAHLVTFGAVSLRTSYAWGLAALWMVSAAVAWWLASSVTSELGDAEPEPAPGEVDPRVVPSLPRARPTPAEVAGWAGLVAATLWLLDPGSSRQGGWNYLMFHGVWPQLLAATLWAASLGFTWRAFASPTPRRLALAISTLGGSLWAHPFGLLTATASGACFVLVLLAAPGARRWPGPWRSFAVIHVGAGLLGWAWLSTFFASADSMARGPVPWTSLGDLGTQLVQGRLLEGHWAWTGPLAGLGAVMVLRRGGARGYTVLILAISMLVLASEEAITVLRLDLVLSGFKNLQFPRYAIPLKPLWFALAGVGLGGLLHWTRTRREAAPRPAWDAAAWRRRAALALVLAPLVATLVSGAGRLVARPVAAVDTLRADGLASSEAELLAALRREAAALPDDRPLVVAVMREGMSGATYPIATVADAGGRLALDSHIPTVNFKHRLRRNARAYAALGVTHVIHDRPVPEAETLLAASLDEVGTFGPFTLERFSPPRGRPRRIAELVGRGSLAIALDEAERLELDVSEVGPRTRLVIGRAPHHRWELTLDGEPLAYDERALDDHGLSGMSAALPHDGHVVLRYVYSEQELRARWISAAMLALCLVGLVLGRPPLATVPPGDTARRVAWTIFGLGTIVAVIGVARRQAHKLEETWIALAVDVLHDDEQEPRSRFVRDLVEEDALVVDRRPERICSGLLGKDVLEGCSEDEHRPGHSFLYRDPYLYRCLRLSLPPHGTAVVRLPALDDDGTVVLGSVFRHVRTGSGKRLRWGLGTQSHGPLANKRHDFVAEPNADGRPPELRFRNDGHAIEQLCVSAAEVERPPP